MINIDTNLFKVFLEVAKTQNITKASENLFITQPAVTQSLNRLEDSLGVKLFIRQSKGVTLTDYGKLVFDDINESLKHINNALLKIRRLNNNENAILKIGCGANIAKWVINKPCKELITKYQTIKIQLYDLKVNELIDKLSNGEIDCFISYSGLDVDKNIENFKVKSTTYCFIGGKNFESLANKVNKIEILKNLPFIVPSGSPSNTGGYFKEICEKYNLNLNIRLEAGRFGTMIEFVRDNIGIAFLPEYVAKEVCDNKNLFIINIDMPLKEISFDIYYNKNYQSKMLLELLDMVKM